MSVRGFLQALVGLLDEAGRGKRLVPSRRDLDRSINYIAYYNLLADPDADRSIIYSRAAENALMHFILPQLSAGDFSQVLRNLMDMNLEPASVDANTVGGLLKPRIERLSESVQGALFSDTVDFWAALS